MPPEVYFTVDLEPDCPPFLSGWRGMERGAPFLLDLLAELQVPATFFTTGDAAQRFPGVVERLLAEGHELGGHGMTHVSLASSEDSVVNDEISQSSAVLRRFGPVISFRAPYLELPVRHRARLVAEGYRVDSSLGLYKPAAWRRRPPSPIRELPASVTSSVLRLSPWLRDPWLARLRSPVVLFVHPWEFVDLRSERLRWDCRMGTGEHARRSLRTALTFFRDRQARFRRVGEVAGMPPA